MAFFPLAFLALLVLAVGLTAWLAPRVARLPGSAPAFADISVDRVLDYLEKSDA